MSSKESGSFGLFSKLVIYAFTAVMVIFVIYAIYLAMPGTDYVENIADSGDNNYSREDFYTEYLESVETFVNGTVDSTSNALSQSVLNSSISATYDWNAQLSAIDTKYLGYSSNFKQITVGNGITYLQEGQSKYWSKCKAGNGSTLKGAGCFYFAASGLISNKTGQIYTVADILSNGNDSCKNITLAYDAQRGFSIASGSMSKVGGSVLLLQQVIDRSPLDAKVVSISDTEHSGLTGFVDESKLQQGTWYFLHAKGGSKGILSDGGEHWMLLIGCDSDNYYFGNNASRGTRFPKSTIDKIKFNHIWEIQQ